MERWRMVLKKMKRVIGFFTAKSAARIKVRPTPIQCAVERGFIDEEQADAATQMISTGDVEETHTDLLVNAGYISETQAEVIALDVERCDPDTALAEQFKKAGKAMREHREASEEKVTQTSKIRLSEVLAAQVAVGAKK